MNARPATTTRFEVCITSSMIHEGKLIRPKARRPNVLGLRSTTEFNLTLRRPHPSCTVRRGSALRSTSTLHALDHLGATSCDEQREQLAERCRRGEEGRWG